MDRWIARRLRPLFALGVLVASALACSTGVKRDCTINGQPVDCSQIDAPSDAGSSSDVSSMMDAKSDTGAEAGAPSVCDQAHGGLFSVPPPCSDTMTVDVNGSTSYVCRCTSPCPCGLACGSVPYPPPVIGVIQHVCSSTPDAPSDPAVCPAARQLNVPNTGVTGAYSDLPLTYDVTVPRNQAVLVTVEVSRSYFTPLLDLVSTCDPSSAVTAMGVAVPGASKKTATVKALGPAGGHIFPRVRVDMTQEATPDSFTLSTKTIAAYAFCSQAMLVTAGQTLMGEDSNNGADFRAGTDFSCLYPPIGSPALLYYRIHLAVNATLTVDLSGSGGADATLLLRRTCDDTTCLASGTTTGTGSRLNYTNVAGDGDFVVAAGISAFSATANTSLPFALTFTVM
jgi:hypothetical protein